MSQILKSAPEDRQYDVENPCKNAEIQGLARFGVKGFEVRILGYEALGFGFGTLT